MKDVIDPVTNSDKAGTYKAMSPKRYMENPHDKIEYIHTPEQRSQLNNCLINPNLLSDSGGKCIAK